MTDRELMQQALEGLEAAYEGQIWLSHLPDLSTALRERLAQPEQDWDWRHPKAQSLIGAKARLEIKLRLIEQLLEDPNFETTAFDMEYWEPLHDKLQKRLAQPEQEPATKAGDLRAMKDEFWKQPEPDGLSWLKKDSNYFSQPQRKPLTDEEIEDIWADCPVDWDDKINVLTLARAIEAAHGIKENT